MNRKTITILVSLAMLGATQAPMAEGQGMPGTRPEGASGYFPMTPSEIRDLMREFDSIEAAKQRPAPPASARRHTIKTIDLTGGPSDEVATVAMGYGTTIIVVGENGEPWPIRNIMPGNQNAITAAPMRKDNALAGIIHVQRPWISTNLTLDLDGKAEPVVIYLRTVADPSNGQHSIIRVRVPGIPPGTQPLPVRNVAVIDDAVSNALAWSPGESWKEIPLKDDALPFHARLWESPSGGRYILRMTAGARLRSPNWTAQERSADGRIHVYEFRKKPVLMVAVTEDGARFNVYPSDPVVTLTEPRSRSGSSITASQAVQEVAAVRRDAGIMPSVTRADYRTKPYTSTYRATGVHLVGKKKVEPKAYTGTAGAPSGRSGSHKARKAPNSVAKKASATSKSAHLHSKAHSSARPESGRPKKRTHAGGVYRIRKQETLWENLDRWCSRDNWELIWDAPQDYEVVANASFKARSLEEAVMQLSDALRESAIPISINVAHANKVIRVTGELSGRSK